MSSNGPDDARTNPSGRSSKGASPGSNALVRTVRQTTSPSGSATTPWAMTCAGPLVGEYPGSACHAAPEVVTPDREKASARSSTIGAACFQALGAMDRRRQLQAQGA